MINWASRQPAKKITSVAVRAVLIGLGVAAGPAAFVAAVIAGWLTSYGEAH